MFEDRVTVLVGHFGSGKTEVAVNGAIRLAEGGARVALADLDLVKPYFRSRAGRELLAAAGVDLVAPEGDDAGDLPIVLPRVRTLCADPEVRVVIDAGGDDTGARALGSLSDLLGRLGVGFDLVLNFRRPFTPDVDSAVAMAREIEAAARLRVTGVVSNTHLMGQTTPAIVLEGCALARETAGRLGVPLAAAVVEERMRDAVDEAALGCPVFPVRRLVQPPFDQEGYRVPRSGPLFRVL
ncbi:MAG: cobalamin biosynthesis protein CbiA [Deltaproteobacteria bacterium]|nr:cobalamin biosynthesis protein CbiA [Deltaproteobacteria bacterium]